MHLCGSVLRAHGWQTVSLLCGRHSQCGSRAGAAYRSGSGCCDGPRLTGLGHRCTDENGGPPRLTSRPCYWGHMWSNWRKSSAHASLSKTWMIRLIRGGFFFKTNKTRVQILFTTCLLRVRLVVMLKSELRSSSVMFRRRSPST